MRGNNINSKNTNQNEVKPLLKIKPKFNLLTALSSKHLGTLLNCNIYWCFTSTNN